MPWQFLKRLLSPKIQDTPALVEWISSEVPPSLDPFPPQIDLSERTRIKDTIEFYQSINGHYVYLLLRDREGEKMGVEGPVPVMILDENRIAQIIYTLQEQIRQMRWQTEKPVSSSSQSWLQRPWPSGIISNTEDLEVEEDEEDDWLEDGPQTDKLPDLSGDEETF